jgi:hypothetical protein
MDVGRAAGYIAIAHAEIQHYFDDRVRELASKAIQEFSAKDLVSREIVGLLTYCGMKDKVLTLDAQQAANATDIASIQRFDNVVDDRLAALAV